MLTASTLPWRLPHTPCAHVSTLRNYRRRYVYVPSCYTLLAHMLRLHHGVAAKGSTTARGGHGAGPTGSPRGGGASMRGVRGGGGGGLEGRRVCELGAGLGLVGCFLQQLSVCRAVAWHHANHAGSLLDVV